MCEYVFVANNVYAVEGTITSWKGKKQQSEIYKNISPFNF